MTELESLIMAIDSEKNVVPGALEVFRTLIGSQRDIGAIEIIVAEELGFDPPRFAFIRLIQIWNSSHVGDEITGLEGYIDTGRTRYLKKVDDMQRAISQMTQLKDVFTAEWFDALRSEIREWVGTRSFTTNNHGAFISYLQFSEENGLLAELNDAFSRLGAAAGRGLKKKRDMPGKIDAYVSTAFEILVTSRFSKIVDYEPKISSGNPEARVELASQRFLIEARATLDMEFGPGGAFDPDEKGGVLASKAREKYAGQLSGAAEPVVLLFALNAVIHNAHVQAMLQRIIADPDSRVLSAMIFSPTFHAQSFQIWIHPNANYPLTVAAVSELKRLFLAEDLAL